MQKRWVKLALIVAGATIVFVSGVFNVVLIQQLMKQRAGSVSLVGKHMPQSPSLLPDASKDLMDADYARRAEVAPFSVPPSGSVFQGASQLMPVAIQPMLIRTANISLQVEDVPGTINQIRQIATSVKGYISQVSQYREGDRLSASVTLRVPSEQYEDSLQRLQGLGQVASYSEEVQDVTEEFIDVEARLRNLKRSEEHLLELLKRTGKVSELLNVERELSNRRSEIERLEGRLRYLKQRVAFSTINVTLIEFRPRPLPTAAFSVAKVIADAFRSVVTTARLLLVGAIWALMFALFFGVPAIVVVWSIYRVVKATTSRTGSIGGS